MTGDDWGDAAAVALALLALAFFAFLAWYGARRAP